MTRAMTPNQHALRAVYPQIDWNAYDREVCRAAETLLIEVTEAAAEMLEAEEFDSRNERRLIRAVRSARSYLMHADPVPDR